ncbi:alanyl-tRNA editing protein [Thermococcus gorgonarius]|uniref:Alanyl-tRNA editing protein AlaX n=1 Tax=Thermococcus gorgonarius TaxID=71997 RepID=A0A2Z2MI05_THEGO|nr:DHHA1 domain-containing protein [Thermococcus gorgonarius]ASJ01598.1 alanyl-tRNA editing protein AlaX [Thermococcus gorgonarius]
MTEKLFYRDPYLREAKARITSIEVEGKRVKLTLDRTIFYPEGGGQPSDRGLIEGNGFAVRVDRVAGKEEIVHEGVIEGRTPKVGEEVRLTLDWEWRYENMRAHTGQHILSAVIKGLYGAETTGFQIFPEYNKIEIDYPGELNWEDILEIERKTNEIIWGDVPVEVEVYDDLPDELGTVLRKEVSSKVKPPIRVVRIGTVDVTPCGGTHVKSTREIGFLKILRVYRKSKKLLRVEFATGVRALKYLGELLEDYWDALNEMPNKNRPLVERVRELKEELNGLEAEKDALRRELWEWKSRALLKDAEDIGGVKVVAHLEGGPLKDTQAFVVYLVDKNPNTVALIGGDNYVIFAKNREVTGIAMNELLREVLKETGGGGGGSEVLARGGGFNVKPEEVISVALKKLKGALQRGAP